MTDLTQFALKLIALKKRQVRKENSSYMYGHRSIELVQVNEKARRIGIWAISSSQFPLVALGFSATLYYLFEAYGAECYRLWFRPQTSDDWVWSESDSQITPDDFVLPQLNENVALWGSLEQDADDFSLTLYLEDDLHPELGIQTFRLKAMSLEALQKPFIALGEKLMHQLDLDKPDALVLPDLFIESSVQLVFNWLAHWEIQLQLALWDSEQFDAETWLELLEASFSLMPDADWLISRAIQQLQYTGYAPFVNELNNDLSQLASQVTTDFCRYAFAQVLFNLNRKTLAFEVLEQGAEQANSPVAYNHLASLYRLNGQIREALITLQTAISNELADFTTFILYASFLRDAVDAEIRIDELLFVEGDDDFAVTLYSEAVGSLTEALNLHADALSIRHQRAQLSLELGLTDFWDDFGVLLEVESASAYIYDLIDNLDDVDALETATDMLEQAVTEQATRFDLRLNLAQAYIYLERYDECLDLVEALYSKLDESYVPDLDRLSLIAKLTDFEYRFSDIVTRLDAGTKLSVDELDFLEEVIAEAPNYMPAYVQSARAYRANQDNSAALEVLLDAQKQVPNNPEIINLLTAYLWEEDSQLALKYLQDALEEHPVNILLIVRAAKCYFDMQEYDLARAYLRQAEALEPTHPAFQSLRVYIAGRLTSDTD